MKFSQDQEDENKNIFYFTAKMFLKVLTKDGINFVYFAWTKVNEMKPRVKIMLKKGHFSNQPFKLRKYSTKFCILAKGNDILQSLAKNLAIHNILWYSTKCCGIK
jgi:hypothetical protein